MPHGHPDYGAAAPTTTIYTIQDMAELAARLGSIVTFDRRGNVIFMEDFESSLAKCITTASAGGSVEISNRYARSGSFSCKMTTGPNSGDWAYWELRCPYPILGRMGFEYSWCRADDDCDLEIHIHLYLYDGTNLWDSSLAWLASEKRWYYFGADSEWHALTPLASYPVQLGLFNTLKLVVDFTTKEYVRLVANNIVYDLSGIALYSEESEENASLIGFARTWTWKDRNAVTYVDDAIITQNEP